MKPLLEHPWELSEEQAKSLQTTLAKKIVVEDQLGQIDYVAGVDVAYAKSTDTLVAAVVVLDAKTLKVVDTATAEGKATFPYISGLFSFRELPPLINAFAKLSITPDLVVCDGHGYAHPRRFGLACHLGLMFDVPTIGCGKTRLMGQHQELEVHRGAVSPLVDDNEVVGHTLRTQNAVNPIFISVGHRISLDTACQWILQLSPRFRLPETTRQADQLVNKRLAAIG